MGFAYVCMLYSRKRLKFLLSGSRLIFLSLYSRSRLVFDGQVIVLV